MVISVGTNFKKVNTEINTFKNPRVFITSGLFKYSRNPIYLGMTTALLGLWGIHGSLYSFIPVIVFWLVCHFWYIPIEERKMIDSFGQDYIEYKTQVRRWL